MEITEKEVKRNREKSYILAKYFKGQEEQFKLVTKLVVK